MMLRKRKERWVARILCSQEALMIGNGRGGGLAPKNTPLGFA